MSEIKVQFCEELYCDLKKMIKETTLEELKSDSFFYSIQNLPEKLKGLPKEVFIEFYSLIAALRGIKNSILVMKEVLWQFSEPMLDQIESIKNACDEVLKGENSG
jgi:hypothetical protein